VVGFGWLCLNKIQAGGIVHMIYKSSISKNSTLGQVNGAAGTAVGVVIDSSGRYIYIAR
jgi:hypothetical protein